MFVVPMTRHANHFNRSRSRLLDEQFFNQVAAPACRTESTTAARTPALDVTETDATYNVRLDMPGVAKDEVKITIEGKRVTVTANAADTVPQAKAEADTTGERLIYSERSAPSYARSFKLPAELNEADSSARMEHGVLTLTLAKRSAGKAAQITVN